MMGDGGLVYEVSRDEIEESGIVIGSYSYGKRTKMHGYFRKENKDDDRNTEDILRTVGYLWSVSARKGRWSGRGNRATLWVGKGRLLLHSWHRRSIATWSWPE